MAQLNFAKNMGVEIRRGDPAENVPGKTIVIPERFSQLQVTDQSLDKLRRSYLRNSLESSKITHVSKEEVDFLAAETRTSREWVVQILKELK